MHVFIRKWIIMTWAWVFLSGGWGGVVCGIWVDNCWYWGMDPWGLITQSYKIFEIAIFSTDTHIHTFTLTYKHSHTHTLRGTRKLDLAIVCISVVLVTQSFLTLCNPWTVACQSPLSMGILHSRILKWAAIPFSMGSIWPRESNPGLPHCKQILYSLSHQV